MDDGTDTDLLLALDLLDMPLRPARLRVDDDLQEEFEQRAWWAVVEQSHIFELAA